MSVVRFDSPEAVMRRALEVAMRGEGQVEPNPMVGCILVDQDRCLIAEGWHERIGEAHAEVNALNRAGARAEGADLYVTLEPCNHQGRTPPCTDAILKAKVASVRIGCEDPARHVDSSGITRLAEAGVAVESGLLESEARRLIAPFRKRIQTGLPWVIAKWAMTLDGRIASRSGDSRWISGSESRALVHRIRGRVDAVIVGSGTATVDDPLLTARPPGARTALRVVIDRRLSISPDSQLSRTAQQSAVLVITSDSVDPQRVDALASTGVEVLPMSTPTPRAVLAELASRGCTNVLIEGGGQLLGAFFDDGLIDEVCTFIAPKLVGGETASAPIGGTGLESISQSLSLVDPEIRTIGGDVCIRGRLHDD